MKVPTAKRLPSGSWNVGVMIDGRRVSITAPTKREAEKQAAALKSGAKKAAGEKTSLTIGEAFDNYISLKESVLSPSTVAGYRRIRKNLLFGLADVRVSELTQAQVQQWVSTLALKKTPKTVANAHGLLSAVLAVARPDFALHTTLPQKVKQEIQIPSEAEARKIFDGCKGTRYELPIMLAVWLGLRASEIRGIRWEDIEGDYVHIRRAIVQGENGPAVKGTKTYSGTRVLHLPPYLQKLIAQQPKDSEYIVELSGHAMYSGFERICEKAGVPHYRFHDLRHLNASIMLAEGVPDKYSMRRMGHATNNMLKTTYQHVVQEKVTEFDRVIETKLQTLFGV